MSVYVDELFTTEPTRQWPYRQACHLTADSSEELHAFAARLKLRRAWAQHVGRPTEHYDLTATRRLLAVQRGAIELTWREAADQAIARLRAAKAAKEAAV